MSLTCSHWGIIPCLQLLHGQTRAVQKDRQGQSTWTNHASPHVQTRAVHMDRHGQPLGPQKQPLNSSQKLEIRKE